MRIAKRDLKKQSQFPKGLNDVSVYIKGDYEDFHALRRRKNKANQSQSAWDAEPAQAIPKAFGFEAATLRRKRAI
jgi:hypothetical protein